jgi:hypothetical protein
LFVRASAIVRKCGGEIAWPRARERERDRGREN